MLYAMKVQPTLIKEIQTTQGTDPQLKGIKKEVLVEKVFGFIIHDDSTVRFQNRMCALAMGELKKKILDEGYNTPCSMHPMGNKMYKDLKYTFWQSNMK